jgi:hypothetical protein
MIPFRRNHGPRRFLVFLLFAILAVLALSSLVMWLWNAILPSLLGISVIKYWQAVGLLILCRILFGNIGPGPGYRRPSFGRSPYWREKWATMSEEERTRFREEWKKRCVKRPN